MTRVLVTGSAGFIGGYVVEELLSRGYEVVGVDNESKYGPVVRSFDDHPAYRLIRGDARDAALMSDALVGCDHLIAGAAMIGGISYFHTYAYDLLATNERILAATCDAAIRAHHDGTLSKVTYLSSSMVFEFGHLVAFSGGPRARDSSSQVVVWFSEARRRVLRPGGAQSVWAAVHHRPAIQLCRRRRGPRARGRRDSQRQRQAGDEPRRARPGPEGAQGAGSLAHPGRRLAGTALHICRRPREGHRDRDGEYRRAQ